MSLVALDGTPLVAVGMPYRTASDSLPGATASVIQDAANEACIMYGHVITDDGASHTIDTTGSSSLGLRLGTVTFANAGSTIVVGLATMDAANGPPGRATNSTDVITPSVSKSLTGGGGGLTANSWNALVPSSGSLSVANGDFIAAFTQLTARGGADTITTQCGGVSAAMPRPGITGFTGGSYAAVTGAPNFLIIFSDGHRGWFYGGYVYATATTNQTWNNGSAAVEFGNFLQFPFPMKVYGIRAACNVAGDCDFVLYSTPLGTPGAEKTVSVDLNTVSGANARYSDYLFASPYTTTASQPLAAIAKPTSATNVVMPYKTYNASADQVTEMCGTNGYAVSRASGAFAAVNSSKDRFAIGLLVGAFDDGASAGTTIAGTTLARGLAH